MLYNYVAEVLYHTMHFDVGITTAKVTQKDEQIDGEPVSHPFEGFVNYH